MTQVLHYDDQVRKFRDNVRTEYEADSIIWNRIVVESRAVSSADSFRFVQIGSRFSLDLAAFTSPSHYPGLIGAGHSIALGEENYLLEMLGKRISLRIDKDKLSSQTIVDAFRETGPNFHPNTVFVPLAFHNPLHLRQILGLELHYDRDGPNRRGAILGIDKSFEKPRVYWSNKYVPFDSLVFVDKSIGEWIVKTDKGHYLTVDIQRAEKVDKIGVVIKTTAYFNIVRPEAGLILRVGQP